MDLHLPDLKGNNSEFVFVVAVFFFFIRITKKSKLGVMIHNTC